MGALRLILGDQLTPGLSSLCDIDGETDIVLMAEVMAEASYVRHHKRKIAFVFAAMRHFAQELRAKGYTVIYVRLDEPGNTGDLKGEVQRCLEKNEALERVVATLPGEWRLVQEMRDWQEALTVPVELREDDRFLSTPAEFAQWAKDRKQLRMEYFYREMRRKTGLLMEGDRPAGGEWNYDANNRKRLPRHVQPPERAQFPPDEVTKEVLDLVADRFAGHFGSLDDFQVPVTRADAERALEHFIADILPCFGDYQDAMAAGEPFLWHSLISASLNCGLLDPMDVCRRAETAWQSGAAPLNAVEGFIRQILGWREYVRGLYWLKMPGYRETNALGADRRLPEFYWTGKTDMRCMAEAIEHTDRYAYSHHIQRLMVTGNFALLAGIAPDEINEWYLIVYADAYEWVELPNTHGMAIYADGGLMASKPYAASANYINKMSDFCSGCAYDHTARTGKTACPFNYLYWDFLARNERVLRGNRRMGLTYANLDKIDADELAEMRACASEFIKQIGAV